MYPIKRNFLQCQYHRHGPSELMNQTTSMVSFSIQGVVCHWTNMEVSDLHFGGMG